MQEQEIQTSANYDKAILTLSGGALAISITFVNSLDNMQPSCLLKISWLLWVISIILILISFETGRHAIRKAIVEYDKEIKDENKIYNSLHYITMFLNWAAGLLFIIGTFLFLTFATQSLTEVKMPSKKLDEIFNQEFADKLSTQITNKIMEEFKKKGPLVLKPPPPKPQNTGSQQVEILVPNPTPDKDEKK